MGIYLLYSFSFFLFSQFSDWGGGKRVRESTNPNVMHWHTGKETTSIQEECSFLEHQVFSIQDQNERSFKTFFHSKGAKGEREKSLLPMVRIHILHWEDKLPIRLSFVFEFLSKGGTWVPRTNLRRWNGRRPLLIGAVVQSWVLRIHLVCSFCSFRGIEGVHFMNKDVLVFWYRSERGDTGA